MRTHGWDFIYLFILVHCSSLNINDQKMLNVYEPSEVINIVLNASLITENKNRDVWSD